MKRLLVITTLLLASCSDDKPTISEAFCNDLRNGATVMNLYDGSDPQDYADDVYGRVALSCPEQLDTNEGLRSYLESWGITPEPPER